MPKQPIRIENPAPGGSSYTNLNRARRYVRSRRAIFTGLLSIRFLSADRRHVAVIDRATDEGYGLASGADTVNKLRAIPFVGDVRKLLCA